MSDAKDNMTAQILPVSDEAIERAAALIAEGLCIAVPTETVYGLAADATNGTAVARIYEIKGRPSFNPLIVHVRNLADAQAFAEFDDQALKLATTHWPGPLTLVLPLLPDSGIATLVTAGLSTIALRCPAHPAMQALLTASGRPLAAPSANASGTISPTRALHVAKSLGSRVPLILDGGPCALGLESTILAVDAECGIRLLRPGPIDFGLSMHTTGLIEAPGQLASHYAPTKPLRINAENSEFDEWHIGFGPISGDTNLSAEGNLAEAASRLFDLLHQADSAERPRIAVAPVPETGLGAAINDRLKRAAT